MLKVCYRTKPFLCFFFQILGTTKTVVVMKHRYKVTPASLQYRLTNLGTNCPNSYTRINKSIILDAKAFQIQHKSVISMTFNYLCSPHTLTLGTCKRQNSWEDICRISFGVRCQYCERHKMKFHAPLLNCGTLKCQTQISKKKRNWKGQKEGKEKTNLSCG